MSVDHYENFPVASLLCPPALRAPISAIYWYARTADDLADEGDATVQKRLDDLAAYRGELHAVADGAHASDRWRPVFEPLQRAILEFNLPLPLLDALLSAFEQDLVKQRYADRPELLDYCERSANPVGRLLLHLHGIGDAAALKQSDAICSALQLINFWQDLGTDVRRGRLYIPLSDCARFGLEVDTVLSAQDSMALRHVMRAMVEWSRALMNEGAPLVHRLPGRSGWELRLVVQGGMRILTRIESNGFDTMNRRPTIGLRDAPSLLWRAINMRRPVAQSESMAA